MSKLFANCKIPAIICAVVAVAGACCWIYQLMNGLAVTGMNNSNSWGLYIMNFMFFVGLSAGGLIVASSAHVFGIENYKKVAMPAVILSIVCICCAGMFILIDLGGVQRIWRLLTGPNFASPLLWDVCVITLYLVINILDLVWMVKGKERNVAVLSRIALPVAILVHSVTAWIFGLQLAKDWYSAIMAPLFVISAMDSGLGLLILSLLGLDKLGTFKVEKKLISNLAGLMATCIAIDGFFVACECLTMGYPGAAGAEALAIMATGATAPFFWCEILLGVLIPFCLMVFAKNRQNMTLVKIACACVVVGVFCKRGWLLLTSFVIPNVQGAAGITLGNSNVIDGGSMWTVMGTYAPTVFEIVIMLGVISVGILGFLALSNKFLGAPKPAESTESVKASKAA